MELIIANRIMSDIPIEEEILFEKPRGLKSIDQINGIEIIDGRKKSLEYVMEATLEIMPINI